jgi:hypothetical protein
MADMVGKAGLQPCGRRCTCNPLSAKRFRKRAGKRREARAWRREAAE